ncbi:hypothetical protein C8J57DRAFT_1085578, partial [Mycena rebaudengoi]
SAQRGGLEYPGLSNFAQTLPTNFIPYLFLCTECWYPHFPNELTDIQSPECDQPNCTGTLYTFQHLSNGSQKRTPLLTLPFIPPEKAIQHSCMQPGKVTQRQEWRGQNNFVGLREPSKLKGFAAFPDLDKPMTDITDRWGLHRWRNGSWDIKDVNVLEREQQFVAYPNGLIVLLFQAVKGACHSTGVLYATICSTPRGICCLREETILVMMFPGPHEPTAQQ